MPGIVSNLLAQARLAAAQAALGNALEASIAAALEGQWTESHARAIADAVAAIGEAMLDVEAQK